MKISRFKTLQFKISLLLAFFAMIPLIGFSLLFLTSLQNTLLSEQKTAVNKQLSLVNDNVDAVFNDMLNNVRYFAEGALLKTADESITDYVKTTASTTMTPGKNGPIEQAIFQSFAEFGKTHPDYQYVYMGTEGGGYIQYPESGIDAGFDPRVRPWYAPAKIQPEGPVLGEPYYFAGDDIVIIGASQAIKGAGGNILGVVAMDMSLSSLTKLFAKATEGSKGYYMLATADGTILADPSNAENNFKNLSEAYGDLFLKAVKENADFQQMDINGAPYFIKSISSDNTHWRYISVVSEAELFKSVNGLEKIIYMVTAVIFVVIIAVGFFVSNSIAKPIKAVTRSAYEISEGNFDVNVQIKASGEVGLLVDAFKKIGITLQEYKKYIEEIAFILNHIAEGNMAFELQSEYMGEFSAIKTALLNISQKLTDTLTQIKVSADQIASGSNQVASGAQILSQGATEQAASIQELSATISEVSNQVSSNAEKAQKANALSKQAVVDVSEGSRQMRAMIGAMEEINSKTNEINGILKMINDITFQTNILALNAAVEAARAGDAGKGFAVVADEVRSLAQKTAEATRNTACLIEGSIQSTKHGTEVVGQATEALSKIVENVEGIAGLLENITGSSIQQSEAIHQIVFGVDQISAVVQNNAATAEESAASSEELSGQAYLLDSLVGQFQFEAETTSGLNYGKDPLSGISMGSNKYLDNK